MGVPSLLNCCTRVVLPKGLPQIRKVPESPISGSLTSVFPLVEDQSHLNQLQAFNRSVWF